jgi:transcriptional repressor NrdR
MEDIVASLERSMFSGGESEVQSTLVGEKLMEALKAVDPVAYIRFASVYRSFRDVESFQAELAELLGK